jgi:hypothetical protein
MPKFKNLLGKTFGRLTVIAYAGKQGHKTSWHTRCLCGNLQQVRSFSLLDGTTQSCGCLYKEVRKTSPITHGQTIGKVTTPEYTIWKNMRARCLNPNHPQFKDWGGRGISIHPDWLRFDEFYDYLKTFIGLRPNQFYALDRIDNNKHYEPGNVRWADRVIQSRNQRIRTDNKSGVKGVRWRSDLNKWEVKIHKNGKCIYLGLYPSRVDALQIRKQAEKLYWT